MKKRNIGSTIFSVCILFLALVCIFLCGRTGTVNAAEPLYIEGNYEYRICESVNNEKYAEVTKYLGNETHVTVPDALGGYPVYGVTLFSLSMEDEERFNQIQSVEFPKTLINLYSMSCMWFENLSDVTIPEGTECIGANAFSRCFSLKRITIPASVTFIAGEISDDKEMEYCVQKGSYADKYLTEAGEKNITRTGTNVRPTALLIDGKNEITKNINISSPSDNKEFCIAASLLPSNSSNHRINWSVDKENVIEYKAGEGLNNYGSRMYFSVKKGGQAAITAISDDGSQVSGCLIDVWMDISCQSIKLSETTYTYDGTEKNPKVIVDNLTEGEDFAVEYSDNVEPGTGTVTIRGIGYNTGIISKSFTITPKKDNGDTGSGKDDHVTEQKPSVTTVPNTKNESKDNIIIKKPSGLKVKNVKRRKVHIQWKKVKGADGYEIYRSTKKKGKYSKVKTIKKAGTLKYTNTKLKNKRSYYYKIRAYKMLNGKKYYSAFTGVKSVKIKK